MKSSTIGIIYSRTFFIRIKKPNINQSRIFVVFTILRRFRETEDLAMGIIGVTMKGNE